MVPLLQLDVLWRPSPDSERAVLLFQGIAISCFVIGLKMVFIEVSHSQAGTYLLLTNPLTLHAIGARSRSSLGGELNLLYAWVTPDQIRCPKLLWQDFSADNGDNYLRLE